MQCCRGWHITNHGVIMDLLELGLSEDQLAGVEKHVEGLKANSDKLKKEKLEAMSMAEANLVAAEEARKVAAESEAKKQEALGNSEEAKRLRDAESEKHLAEISAERDKVKSLLDKNHIDQAKNGVLNSVLDHLKPAAEAVLDKAITVSYDENGNAKTMFKHGDKEFNSKADFLDGVKDDAMWSGMLKGADSSGAGTKQSSTTGGASPSNYAEMTTEQKVQHLKNNPVKRVQG